jgi:uncharacterized protein YuzE
LKTIYDPHIDTLTIQLRPGPIVESKEGKPGVILDYDKDGNLVSLEILDASTRIPDARTMQFEIAA